MEDINLIQEALKFMLLGMGIVFMFLYIMVLVVKMQHYIIHKYFPTKAESVIEDKKSSTSSTKIIAAITAAIEYHQDKKGNING